MSLTQKLEKWGIFQNLILRMMTNSKSTRLRERLINLAGSLYLLSRKKNASQEAGVILLNYHEISGRSFRRHLDYIRLHYQVLSPESFLDWLYDGRPVDRLSVVITFDDGYLSFYEEIYPILKKTKTSVFMFLPTGCIGKPGYFWFDELRVAIQKSNARAIIINNKKFYLYSRLYRLDFYTKILQYMCSLEEEGRTEMCKQILGQLSIDLTEDDMREFAFLNWPQVLEMDQSRQVVFGSHTVSHPNLTSLSCDMLRFELRESKRILEDHLGKPVLALAYPYGGPGFFDQRVVGELEKTGYSCAFTGIQGRIGDKRRNRYKLNRVMLFDYQNEGAVALKLQRYTN
jgi:peptidoglycan/xylan/chitin deacetylase (PgdA/CDA1 family)